MDSILVENKIYYLDKDNKNVEETPKLRFEDFDKFFLCKHSGELIFSSKYELNPIQVQKGDLIIICRTIGFGEKYKLFKTHIDGFEDFIEKRNKLNKITYTK